MVHQPAGFKWTVCSTIQNTLREQLHNSFVKYLVNTFNKTFAGKYRVGKGGTGRRQDKYTHLLTNLSEKTEKSRKKNSMVKYDGPRQNFCKNVFNF